MGAVFIELLPVKLGMGNSFAGRCGFCCTQLTIDGIKLVNAAATSFLQASTAALLASTKRVALTRPKMRFSAHNSLVLTSLPSASTSIPDHNDDLTRELEFYRICRTAATDARALLKKEKVSFTRPPDYFAEMVKSDEHMGMVKKKLYDEAASKKAASEARRVRDAKKFGKAVQVAKEQERA